MASKIGTGRFLASIKSIMETPFDPTLVDSPPKLLDVLNKSDRLPKLLNRRDERGYTLLHVAAEKNRPESLKCLLIKDANPNVRSGPMSYEVTPLHIASCCGHLACLQLLVQSGGDILARDLSQRTPIDYANANGQELCLKYLNEVIDQRQAEGRKDLEDILVEVERNLAADNVQTLNHWVVFNEHFPSSIPTVAQEMTQMESMLYRHCVLINNLQLTKALSRISKDIPITLNNGSVLHAACRYGRENLGRLLIEKVPEIMLSMTNEGYHPLHIAVASGHLGIVKILVQTQVQCSQTRYTHLTSSGVNIEGSLTRAGLVAKYGATTLSGHTVLHIAVALNDTDILSYLLRHLREIQLNIDNCDCGYTALHLAVYLNHYQAAQILLRKGACVNSRIDTAHFDIVLSRTPLTEAAVNRNLELVNLLVEYGAEDKYHDALRVCLPSSQHVDFVVPLLGTLVKNEDGSKTMKPQHVSRKDRQKMKLGAIDWSNLQLQEVQPSWISHTVSSCMFVRTQSLDDSRVFDCITTLSLTHNHLVWLPAEVFRLPKLTFLNASNNLLESLPDMEKAYNSKTDNYEWPCGSLSKVYLMRNVLVDIPHFLFEIPSLSHLDISFNGIQKLPVAIWSSPKLFHFNCSHNDLKDIPSNWPSVLQTCTVVEPPPSPSPTQANPGTRKKRHKHTSHDVPRYLQSSMERSMDSQSPQTGSKDAERRSGSEDVAVSKVQDRLNICNGNLPIEWTKSDLKEEVYDGLAILNLSFNRIQEVPDNFPCLCPKLTRLDLSHNQISHVSFPRSFPFTLKHINLSHNLLTEIDSENNPMKPLPCTNPTVILDAGNVIHVDNVSYCCHRQHSHLNALSILEMNDCLLTLVNLYSPVQNKHKSRRNHDGEHTHSSTTSKRGRLVCPLITRLVLSHNHLVKVPESVCEMVSLSSLDLSHNEIIELPACLGRLCNLWEFPLNGLKLISPPHNIIERGKTKDIIGFLWSLLQRARPYHRMKLMLIGMAARGKTTLLERISDKGQRGIQENWGITRMKGPPRSRQGQTLSTVGIVVSDWTYYKRVRESQTSLKSITFMTWDFGGQEEYYATHQCFLSRRSLYLAVWNASHGLAGAEELKPWLLNIQARAPNSPVILVGTHLDKVTSRAQKAALNQCIEFIDSTYGSQEHRREGFPQVMGSMIVSCKNSHGIKELRDLIFDVASQVKENTVAGRGIGCGRIPDYRLLMDQLVPASYLQLEDTVRNIALSMRTRGKPPVLTYKDLREMVFTDRQTLISRNTADRELEQAVRFLHDNGTLLHYEDPLLSDFYFVDPQWLCDMLAHIVTVREINPLVRDGIMRVTDFPLIFNDCEFPIRWQREYIRLLTNFEVAVELAEGELLIPSMLPEEKPKLPQTMFPEELKTLPPLRHTYIVPFIPSGFWPRLMSRILTDPTITQLAKDGCGFTDEDLCQLSWIKWRQGLILQYGNLTLVSIEELRKGLFPKSSDLQTIKILRDNKWETHRAKIKMSGIDVVVPDIFPVLKFPEVCGKLRVASRKGKRPKTDSSPIVSSVGESPHSKRRSDMHPETQPIAISVDACLDQQQLVQSHDLPVESHDMPDDPSSSEGGVVVSKSLTYGCTNKVVDMDQLDSEFEKLTRMRSRLASAAVLASQSPPARTGAIGPRLGTGDRMSRPQSPLVTAGMGGGVGGGGGVSSTGIQRAGSCERKVRTSSDERSATPQPYKPVEVEAAEEDRPLIDEERHDIMRAGLLSKVVDHIQLLIEEWFTGVRPRHLIVPCPYCTEDYPHRDTILARSFSNHPSLVPEAERKARGLQDLPNQQESPLSEHFGYSNDTSSVALRQHQMKVSPKAHRRQAQTHFHPSPQQKDRRPKLCQDRHLCYAFRYDDCVVMARTLDSMFCPAHGGMMLQYLAPDTLFLTEGRDILVNPQDLIKEESIGHGGFSTVYQARFRKKSGEAGAGDYISVALKALTKEWRYSDVYGSNERRDEEGETGDRAEESGVPRRNAMSSKPLSRHSIIEGFTNLKKELTILSPLRHEHVIKLFGVMLRPLGLVLELAPRGSLKKMLDGYAEANVRLRCNTAQAVIMQVASAIKYLHANAIIYRDLKSENVLVWQFPDPHDPISSSTRLGVNMVYVKLSDYGISQFVATHGARGLVGTPGFMAPEILKYHGREAYSTEVDIFSFGMFIYELVALHIPYENLTAQQANQSNESGTRPALSKKDLPCPVLLREMMVWCWQQHPDDRPKADQIIVAANDEQFLRLFDGIRASNGGQVTAACVRLSTTSASSTRTLPRPRTSLMSSTIRTSTSATSQSPVLDQLRSSSDRSSSDVVKTPPSTVQIQTRSSGLHSVTEETADDNFVYTFPGAESRNGELNQSGTDGRSCDQALGDMCTLHVKDQLGDVNQAVIDQETGKPTAAVGNDLPGKPLGRSSPSMEQNGKEDGIMDHSKSIGEEPSSDGGPTSAGEPGATVELHLEPGSPTAEPTQRLQESYLDERDLGASASTSAAKESQKSTVSNAFSTADSGFYTNQTASGIRSTITSQFIVGALSVGSEMDRCVCDEDLPSVAPPSPPQRERRHSTPSVFTSGITGETEAQPRPKPEAPPVTEKETKAQNRLEAVTNVGKGKRRYTAPQISLRGSSTPEDSRARYNWSPRLGGGMSPAYDSLAISYQGGSSEEEPVFEVWSASSDAHHSIATVIEYNGKFTSVEDIEVGDSPVLCMCPVRDKIWMGFEIGYLMIFDAPSKRPYAQAWIRQYLPILSIVHVAPLKRVFLALGNGSILAFDDDLSSLVTTPVPARIRLPEVSEYHDPSQSSTCLLVVPRSTSQPQSGGSFELWVGQKNGLITVLDAATLNVVKFIRNSLDLSKVPSYVTYLTYANLVCGVNPKQAYNSTAPPPLKMECGIEEGVGKSSPICVYGAFYHGQYVTRWDIDSQLPVESFNCEGHFDSTEECSISSLQYSNLQLYLGMKNGELLILSASSFDCLCKLSCHRDQVNFLFSVDLAQLQQPESEILTSYSREHHSRHSSGSNPTPPLSHSSNPSPISLSEGVHVHRSPSLSSVQSVGNTQQLLSIGTGFKSYFDGPESKRHLDSGFLLVWDSDYWNMAMQ